MEEADLAAEDLAEEVFEAVDLEEEAEEVSDHMAVVRVEDHSVGQVPDE